MAAAAEEEEQIPSPSPPTYRFRPTKRELITHYLLPRARGQDPYPGVIFEDDAAGRTLPWDLFERHGVGSEDEAYFIVRAGEGKKKPGARQDRGCDGGVGIWKMQSSRENCVRVRGEKIRVHVSNLNLHMGKGKNSGSVGWVMHEYTIAAPPCPSPVKICHIVFSGHGQKRMRVPDRQEVCQSSGHARVGATASALPCSCSGASALPCSGAILDHGSSVAYASGGVESSHLLRTDGNTFRQSPPLDGSDLQCFPSAASEQYPEFEAQVPITEQQNIMALQSMVQQSTMPVAQQLSAAELEFWSSIGVVVQSNNSFEPEQSTKVQSSWVVPNTNAMATGVQSSYVVPSNGAMATTGVQSSWVVPNTNTMATGVQSRVVPSNSAMPTGVHSSYLVPRNGAMARGVQSSYLVPSNMATEVQSSYVVPSNGAMATRFQSSYMVPSNGAMATGVQSSWMVPNNGAMTTGIESSWVVPNTGATAGDLDDFCRSILGIVPNSCAAPDLGNMATRTLGGGCSLTCK